MINPKACEIWQVDWDWDQCEYEINKKRPSLVISIHASDAPRSLRIVVPITEWNEKREQYPWFYKLENWRECGLDKPSCVNTFQIKSYDLKRFDPHNYSRPIGSINKEDILVIIDLVKNWLIDFN